MFNGIVESTGVVHEITTQNKCKNFTIYSKKLFTDLQIDDSIAINGVCLTVTKINGHLFDVTAVPETLRLTNLDILQKDSIVNLERSMKISDRISGHYVQGHVDGMGEIVELNQDGNALLFKISLPAQLAKYVVNKGYISLDGMSITVICKEENNFTVTLIPHTQQITIVNQYVVGSKINIEVDILGKYVENFMGAYQS